MSFAFDVFISYRRSDGSAFARALRRKLLDYRFPGALRSYQQNRKLVVYLDRIYEFATEDFFEKTIKPALDSSRQLIVVATPDASKPRADGEPSWVVREIDHFIEVDASRVVSVAVAKGALMDSLPANIGQRLPRVQRIDIRGLSPFKRLWPPNWSKVDDELLAFIASLYGVAPADMPALRREEARRRAARGWSWAAAGGVVAVVLFVLLVWALNAERTARSQANALRAERVAVSSRDRAFEMAARAFETSATTEAERVLWKLLDGALLRQVLPVNQNIRSVRFAPGGPLALATFPGGAITWQLATGKPMISVQGDDIRYSPRGTFLLGWRDPDLVLWDAATGESRGTLAGAGTLVSGNAISNDESRVATLSRARLMVWDLQRRDSLDSSRSR